MPHVELFTIRGSNACLSTELLLDHAGIAWRERHVRPVLHVASVRLRGFPKLTVPAARIDGERVQGSRRIARRIAELVPDAGLLPEDPNARERVLAAERQAERFQVATRRFLYLLAQQDTSVVRPLVDANFRLVPAPARRVLEHILVAAASKGHGAHPDRLDHELDRAAALLDGFDALVEQGVIGGERPNVADFQLAPNLAALALSPDLSAVLRARPVWRVAELVMTDYPLVVEVAVPTEWLARLSG